MLTGTGELYPGAISTTRFEMATRGMTKPIPESSCEMGIVAKAAGVRDFAEMLTFTERRPTFQKLRGVIQTNGID
jgi:hypothetical protein